MKIHLALTALFLFSLVSDANETEWPYKYQAAVSLSYDDALPSQLKHAIPALDKYGFKASFYLTLSNPGATENIEQWRQVALNGHELGNHTIYHPCRKTVNDREWVADHNDLDVKTIAQVQQEINVANAFLQAIDGKTERTYTAPCGDLEVSDGNYVNVVRDSFIAVKGNNPQYDQKFDALFMPNNTDSKTLIEFVERVRKQGGVANILFHGVGGDYLSVSNKAHDELLQYLSDNRETLWVDTYMNIMNHVKSAHD